MNKKLTIGLIVLLAVVFIPPALAYALAAPESMSIQEARAIRNLVETGDMAVVFHYRIEYDSYAGLTPASQTIIFRLYSANGTSLLAVSRPYVYSGFETNGYGDGVSSFYFAAADAPTWGAAYRINIFGVPAYYDPIQTMTYTMTSADYSDAVLEAASRSDLYNTVITLCDTFGTIYPEVTLKATTDSGVVLSGYGETYFRGAVPGLQTMCPALFFIQTYVPEKMAVEDYDMSLQTDYTARLVGTDIERGANRLGEWAGGIGGNVIMGLGIFIACIAVCIFTMRKGWGLEPGMLVGIGIVVLGSMLVGSFLFTLVMIIGLLAAMGIMYVFAYKKA